MTWLWGGLSIVSVRVHRWPNVYTNLKNIDYCTDQFNYIT